MLNYLNYLNDKKEIKTRFDEIKSLLGHSKILDKYGKQVIEYDGMSAITFELKNRVEIYERWLDRLNNLTFKQRMFYEGTEYLRG